MAVIAGSIINRVLAMVSRFFGLLLAWEKKYMASRHFFSGAGGKSMDEFQRRMIVQSISPPVQLEVAQEEATHPPFPYRWYLCRALLIAALLVFLFYES